MTRRASISSRIFMEPISAVKAEPERPATMIEVRSTPSSRRTRMPMRSTTNGVAPNLMQLEDALLRDDAADQEGDQHDDRHAAIGDLFELVDHAPCRGSGWGWAMTRRRAATSSPRKPTPPTRSLPAPATLLPTSTRKSTNRECATASARSWKPAIGDLVEKDALLRRRIDEIRRKPVAASSCRVRSSTQAPRVSSRSTPGQVDDDAAACSASAEIVGRPGARPSAACSRRPATRRSSARDRLPPARSISTCGSVSQGALRHGLIIPPALIPLGDSVSLRHKSSRSYQEKLDEWRASSTVAIDRFPIAGTFTIARGSRTEAVVVTATIGEHGAAGHGECVPYARYGETVEGVAAADRGHRGPGSRPG